MGKQENNGRDETNWGIIYVYMEMSLQNPLHYYDRLIQIFLKRREAGNGVFMSNLSYRDRPCLQKRQIQRP
jgi:hypothetical protein